MEPIFLSIVIPIYNEEKRIAVTLEKIISYGESLPYRYELILVMDGCKDRSIEVSRSVLQQNAFRLKNSLSHILETIENYGKGFSVRSGFKLARGEYVLFSDADLSTPIEEVEKLLVHLKGGYDIAIGSRSMEGSEVVIRQNVLRQSMGKAFNLLVRMVMRMPFKDTQCGFKCFNRQAVEKIFPRLTVNGFTFDVEILWLAKKLGFRTKEVPIRWVNSPDSKVHVIKHSIDMLVTLFSISRLHVNAK